MEKSVLAKHIVEVCRLTGTFTLRSGRVSSEYFDKYRFEARPRLLESVAQGMAPLIPGDTDLLAGLEMGGIPLAVALSLQTGKPLRFVRKTAKTYGTCQICEGGDIQGKTLCLVEDVITTGGQALLSARELRRAGGKVSAVVCVVYRGDDPSNLKKEGLQLLSLFTLKELKTHAGIA